MALKKLTDNNKGQILNDIKANTGTARLDEYYFQTAEVQSDELFDLAYKKDSLITITRINDRISKMTYLNSLT